MGTSNDAVIDSDGLHIDTTNGLIGFSIGINGSNCEPVLDYTTERGSGVGVNLYGITPSWYSIAWRNSATQWLQSGVQKDFSQIDSNDLANLVVANFSMGDARGADGKATVRSFTVGDTKYIFGSAPDVPTPVTPTTPTQVQGQATPTAEAAAGEEISSTELKPARTGIY